MLNYEEVDVKRSRWRRASAGVLIAVALTVLALLCLLSLNSRQFQLSAKQALQEAYLRGWTIDPMPKG